MNMSDEVGKRAARAVLENMVPFVEKAVSIRPELVMESYDPKGGMRMYRLNHPTAMDGERFIVVTSRSLDRTEAQRFIPPHHTEGASEVDHNVPAAKSKFPGVNFQGPQNRPGEPDIPEKS